MWCISRCSKAWWMGVSGAGRVANIYWLHIWQKRLKAAQQVAFKTIRPAKKNQYNLLLTTQCSSQVFLLLTHLLGLPSCLIQNALGCSCIGTEGNPRSEQRDVMGTRGECHIPLTLACCKKSPLATQILTELNPL